jgi:hypothetical protein
MPTFSSSNRTSFSANPDFFRSMQTASNQMGFLFATHNGEGSLPLQAHERFVEYQIVRVKGRQRASHGNTFEALAKDEQGQAIGWFLESHHDVHDGEVVFPAPADPQIRDFSRAREERSALRQMGSAM